MEALWKKLNLKDQDPVVVLDAPGSFAPAMDWLRGSGRRVETAGANELPGGCEGGFVLAFCPMGEDFDRVAGPLAEWASSGGVVWVAYPKQTSRRFKSDVNRDILWERGRGRGLDAVRQVAIDEDWSALRFKAWAPD